MHEWASLSRRTFFFYSFLFLLQKSLFNHPSMNENRVARLHMSVSYVVCSRYVLISASVSPIERAEVWKLLYSCSGLKVTEYYSLCSHSSSGWIWLVKKCVLWSKFYINVHRNVFLFSLICLSLSHSFPSALLFIFLCFCFSIFRQFLYQGFSQP